jgi:ABC-2 type transport system ATP-binding protein
MTGGIEEVVRAYEGEDAARHVREVLEEHREDWSATATSTSREEQTTMTDE